MISSNGIPSSSAPWMMSSRFTARANALSFIFFFTELTSTSWTLFDGPNIRHCHDESAQLIDGVKRLFHWRLATDAGVTRVRKNRATNLVTPSVLAQPVHADKWMTFTRTLFDIWMTLVIHVVQQTNCFPQIRIGAAQLREMFHGIGNCVAMPSQTFRLHPLMKNFERAICKFSHIVAKAGVGQLGCRVMDEDRRPIVFAVAYKRFPRAEYSINFVKRRARVSSFFALITHHVVNCR